MNYVVFIGLKIKNKKKIDMYVGFWLPSFLQLKALGKNTLADRR